jgi:4-hydroxy 2-oxovalerate aldolase
MNAANRAAAWVGYRPEIKIIDCTIRDGGLMNDHQFDETVVRAVVEACAAGGIDYVELGYKNNPDQFDPATHGPWKFCREDDLKRVTDGVEHLPKISVMADVDRVDYQRDIVAKDKSVIDMVRVACYIHQVPGALDMVKDAHDKGYETTINLMALSTVKESELASALDLFARSETKVLYVVDSFGSLYSEQTRAYVQQFLVHARQAGMEVGLHAHNNQQLAFANSIEAIVCGANFVDGSLAGLGRGAGNCNTELLAGFLHNPRYHMRPLLHCIQHHIEPMRAALRWGFDIPYMLLGQLNQHPRSAIKFNEGPDHGDYVTFYDRVIEEE